MAMIYYIIEAKSPKELKRKVNELSKLTFRPQGGVCVIKEGFNKTYFQAMVSE